MAALNKYHSKIASTTSAELSNPRGNSAASRGSPYTTANSTRLTMSSAEKYKSTTAMSMVMNNPGTLKQLMQHERIDEGAEEDKNSDCASGDEGPSGQDGKMRRR